MISREPWRQRRMKRRRKVIVEIATSADGYIARLDGDVSWLDRPQRKGHYGMGAFMKSIDTILWGRKTYTKGIEMGMKDGGFGPKIKNSYGQKSQTHWNGLVSGLVISSPSCFHTP